MSGDTDMHIDEEMVDSDVDLDDDEVNGNDSSMMVDGAAAAVSQESVEEDSAKAKRRAIQAIMSDKTITDEERRMRVQSLMSGGRTEVTPPQAPAVPDAGSSTCVHYERNCNIVAPCCNRVFGCRVCHDELSPSGHPPMNRFLVREVVCKKCNCRQAAS